MTIQFDPSTSAVLSVYAVGGMTCDNCVHHVTQELESLGGVDAVAIDLVPGGASTVRVGSDAPLSKDAVREAVEEAGYSLVG